jgi:hypothetical protein
MSYTGTPYASDNERRKALLANTFRTTSCMVEGCSYNRTYDVHRLIPGRDGGEYVIGNMFLICPNHHAEVTRGIIELEKIDDCTLRVSWDRYGRVLEPDVRADLETQRGNTLGGSTPLRSVK